MPRVTTRPFAVIFDFDGVILDSETPEYEAHRQMFFARGLELTPADWCDTIGTCDDPRRWFERLLAAAPSLAYEQYLEEKRRLFRALVRMEPVRGVDALLSSLERAGVPKAVASNASGGWVQRAAAEMGLVHRFDAIVTADDVERPKPAPDVYLQACERIGVAPHASVAIEDSTTGVAAARAAGLKVVAIRHWLTRQHDVSAADLIVEHAGMLTIDLLRTLATDSEAR